MLPLLTVRNNGHVTHVGDLVHKTADLCIMLVGSELLRGEAGLGWSANLVDREAVAQKG